MKLLHLNIFKGKFLDRILDFSRKNDFDFLQLQEVAGGEQSFNNSDDFERIKNDLQYRGEIVKTSNPVEPSGSYFGNATFVNPKYKILKSDIIWLKEFDPDVRNVDKSSAINASRAAVSLLIENDGRKFYLINGHLAWGPTPLDDEYKIIQAKILLGYIKNLQYPFVLSGDFNVLSETKTASMFEEFGINLTKKHRIESTLNPNIHFLKQKTIEEKIAVDLIFVSDEINVLNFKRIDDDLSDHLGLFLEFDLF